VRGGDKVAVFHHIKYTNTFINGAEEDQRSILRVRHHHLLLLSEEVSSSLLPRSDDAKDPVGYDIFVLYCGSQRSLFSLKIYQSPHLRPSFDD